MPNHGWKILLSLACVLASFPTLVSAETVFEEVSIIYDAGRQDSLSSAAVDIAGNMYLTGVTDDVERTYFVAKYDSHGHEKWIHTDSSSTQAREMIVDRNGNAYVALSSKLGKILKYDTDGNESILADPRIVPYGCCGWPVGLVLDKDGNNLYSWASHTIQKISLDGSTGWIQRFHTASYSVRDIEADNSGNIYVVGHSVSVHNRSAPGLIVKKLDSLGNVIWSQFWHAEGDGDQGETVHGLELDSNNNVYLLTQSLNYEDSCRYCVTSFVVRFSSDGYTMSSAILNGTDGYMAGAMKVADDKVYVTMRSRTHMLTAQKLNTDLSLAWSSEYSNGFATPLSLDVDGFGNVLVGFRGQYNAAAVKFDTHGDELWTQNFDGNDLKLTKFGPTGEVYVAGNISSGFGPSFTTDAVMYRYGVAPLSCQ